MYQSGEYCRSGLPSIAVSGPDRTMCEGCAVLVEAGWKAKESSWEFCMALGCGIKHSSPELCRDLTWPFLGQAAMEGPGQE